MRAQASPASAEPRLFFSHDDGTTVDISPHEAFYYYPGTFDLILDWRAGSDGGTELCGTVTVVGEPTGYRNCDSPPDFSGQYRVSVPLEDDDPDNGLLVRAGPGVDKPAIDVLAHDTRGIRLTGCWQPVNGLNPWWQIEGGGWSSSCCLIKQ